ncbi:MAG: site-2 protease family protein [Clostridia bacterium]|nr:site-2 protease family protein [Clostridia bacterium]
MQKLKVKQSEYRRLKIKISPLFLLIALAFIAGGRALDFIIYIASTSLHEIAHAQMAKKLGYALVGVNFMPYGVALCGEFESITATDEILIAVVGPLFNLAIAVLIPSLWWFFPQIYPFTYSVALINLGLGIINLIPAYPLDGGRVLLAIYARKLGRAKAYKKVRIIGFIAGLITAILAVASCFFGANLTLMSISAFIILSSFFPDGSRYESLYRHLARAKQLKRGLAVKEVLISPDTPVKRLLENLNINHYTRFVAVSSEMEKLFCISETDLELIEPNDRFITAIEFYRLKAKQSDK